VVELKAKHGLILQVDGVIENNYDDGTVDATTLHRVRHRDLEIAHLSRKGKGRSQELSLHRQQILEPGSSPESLPKRMQERLGVRREELPVSVTLLFSTQ
jgi:hypothetical protein